MELRLLRTRGAWRGYSARRGVPQRVNPNFEIDVIDMRTHEPPYRLGEGVRVAVGSPYGCEHRRRRGLPPCRSALYSTSNPAILQGAHGLGIEGISIHRHFVALQYRAEPAAHRGDDETGRRRDFLAGRPWRFTELVPHALEDDWDVDESVDEINEERAEIWGKLDAAAAAQGKGIGRAWRLASGDDVVGRRHRRPHAGGDAPPVFDRRGWQPLA